MKQKNTASNRNIIQIILSPFKYVFVNYKEFIRNIAKSFFSLSKREKFYLLILVVILFSMLIVKAQSIYLKSTEAVPASGGIYKELLFGEAQYLSPILAKTDAERTISRLIYSGLVKMDLDGNIVPDLAETWVVSDSGLTYSFSLKAGVQFQNGQNFDAYDVQSTIEAIKNPEFKSPYISLWENVEVNVVDEYNIDLTLPSQYGPFIFRCLQGIVDSDDLSESLVGPTNGTGPYALSDIKENEDNEISDINLIQSQVYYGEFPYIEEVSFVLTSEEKLSELMVFSDYSAIAGSTIENESFSDLSFKTNRILILFPNLKNELLANADNRRKLFKFERFDEPITLNLITLDGEAQLERTREFEEHLKDSNVVLNVDTLKSTDFNKRLQSRDFDLVMYGCDCGYDQDPYTFWHTTQATLSNFSGYSDKASDILLEDARMLQNIDERNAKYEEFFLKVENENLAIIFERKVYEYFVSEKLMGVEKVIGFRQEDRVNSFENWYIKEKRVKK